MENQLSLSKSSPLKILLEIIVVLGIMLSVKWVADLYQITGAGSIAIWTGILIGTLFMRREGIRWRDFGVRLPKGLREWIKNILIGLLTVFLVGIILGLLVDPLLQNLGFEKPADVGDRFTFFLGKPWVFITYLVTVIWIGAALGEELLMRGFLLNRLAAFFGSTRFAWIISVIIQAAIFGSLHAYQGTYGMISTGVIGLIFGIVYLVAGKRLLPLVLAHLILNTVTITSFYINGGMVN